MKKYCHEERWKMPTDKFGKKLTWKEWLQRWKRGIEGITPLQQANIQIKGTYIIILGLCAGIFITALNIKSLWWLTLILVGGLFNSVMQWVGLYQKKNILERLYNIEEDFENKDETKFEQKLKSSEKEVDSK